MGFTSTTLGLVYGLAASVIWGGMYVVSKVVLEVIPPFALVTLRLLLGALVLGCILAWRGFPPLTGKQVREVLLVGFVGYGASLGLQFQGTHLSTAANASLVTSATPAFIFLFAKLFLHEAITPRRLLALILSSAGVLAVIVPLDGAIAPGNLLGDSMLFGAGLTWALHSVLVRKISSSVPALALSTIALLGGLPLSLPAALWELRTLGIGPITWQILAGVLFLGIVSTALAMYLWNRAFALLDAGLASLTFFAQPLVGTSLGILVLGESVTLPFLLGAALIGFGLLLASQGSWAPHDR
jgi:drug/metabolite transporter (DMT)-like permease